jgi:two-component system nitrate/nitrite response regulator NarL
MRRMRPLRVYVVEEQPLYRDALCRMIHAHPYLEFVGAAQRTVPQAPGGVLGQTDAEVYIVDAGLIGDTSESATAWVRACAPGRLVALFGRNDDAVHHVIAAGAAAALSKQSHQQALTNALVAVGQGEHIVSAQLQTRLVAQVHQTNRGTLTAREREVAALTARGFSGPQIAERLWLSPHTVRTYLQRIYEKLGVNDRAAMVTEALRREGLSLAEIGPATNGS